MSESERDKPKEFSKHMGESTVTSGRLVIYFERDEVKGINNVNAGKESEHSPGSFQGMWRALQKQLHDNGDFVRLTDAQVGQYFRMAAELKELKGQFGLQCCLFVIPAILRTLIPDHFRNAYTTSKGRLTDLRNDYWNRREDKGSKAQPPEPGLLDAQ